MSLWNTESGYLLSKVLLYAKPVNVHCVCDVNMFLPFLQMIKIGWLLGKNWILNPFFNQNEKWETTVSSWKSDMKYIELLIVI